MSALDAAGWLFLAACTGIFVWVTVCVAVERRPPHLRRIGLGALAALWAVTGLILIRRFTMGLGPVSGMSDAFPWGIWIGIDVMSGVALAAGGYVLTATVHLFSIKRFEPIVRPAVLTAFLGYILVAVGLLVDVGRPYRMWHPLVMWQHHSIMFEVAWCVTLYTTVLAAEFSPIVFEGLGLERPLRIVKMISIPLVILGVTLSTLHQSSLGSMFLIVPEKLHPFWYTPLLPVFFLASSVAVGMSMTVVESFFSARVFRRSLETPLMSTLGRATATILFLYVGVKAVDLFARGAAENMLRDGFETGMLFLELGVGALLPAYLLSRRRFQDDPRVIVGAAGLVVFGVVLNRLNVSWFGMLHYTGWVYFPSWMELALSLTFITVGVIVFGAAVRFLPIFPKHAAH